MSITNPFHHSTSGQDEGSDQHLFELIMRRDALRSALMTSNRPVEDWGHLIGDVPATGAIFDRLLQSADIIPFKGRSYRLHNRAAQQDIERKNDIQR